MNDPPIDLDALFSHDRGDRQVLDEVLSRFIDEVREIAKKVMAGENPSHTLQTTALVHEAYLKLAARPATVWNNRKHFLCDLAGTMRRILCSHARRKRAGKRGGGALGLPLDESRLPFATPPPYLDDLEEALDELEAVDRGKYDVVMLRFFMGLTEKEIGQELGVTVNTVQRRWQAARLWLLARLGNEAP